MVGENLKFTHLKWIKKIHLNCPPWLEKNLKYTHLKWLKNTLKLSTMVGENFEIYSSQVDKTLKSYTMVGEKFKMYSS